MLSYCLKHNLSPICVIVSSKRRKILFKPRFSHLRNTYANFSWLSTLIWFTRESWHAPKNNYYKFNMRHFFSFLFLIIQAIFVSSVTWLFCFRIRYLPLSERERERIVRNTKFFLVKKFEIWRIMYWKYIACNDIV